MRPPEVRAKRGRHPEGGAAEEVTDERHAALRRFMRMATAGWTSFFLVDLVAAHAHAAPLEYLAALRFTGTGVAFAAYAAIRAKRVHPRILDVIELGIFPMGAALVALGAVPCGGIASPLAQGVGIITLVRAVLPAPWQRALPSALSSALMFPIVIGIAAFVVPSIKEQMHSAAVWTFLQTSLFLGLSAALGAAGSHMQWEARRQVDEARRLGTYRLVARIGSGGMGEVWLARQLPLDRRVALKILKQRVLAEPGALRRFKREAQSASRLGHPHTIRVFDFGASDDGVFFIAMELLDGLDLEAVVARTGALPPARAVHLARQACGSLSEAHHLGIVHCDVKPANIFLTKVGEELDFVKVLDFGLAHVNGPGSTTVVDTIRGTPAFMSPEQVRGERVGPESDVYAMGALLYFMLSGHTVFESKAMHEMVLAQLEAKPDPPSKKLGAPLPEDLEAVVMRCLAKGRGDRYTTAKELEEALATCACAKEWTQEDARVAWDVLRPSMNSQVTKP